MKATTLIKLLIVTAIAVVALAATPLAGAASATPPGPNSPSIIAI
jgi:hypothetical protein